MTFIDGKSSEQKTKKLLQYKEIFIYRTSQVRKLTFEMRSNAPLMIVVFLLVGSPPADSTTILSATDTKRDVCL
jgi:hypothetical protein